MLLQMKRKEEQESCHRVPLEIKTGKMYRKQGTLEHRAQVTVYTTKWLFLLPHGLPDNNKLYLTSPEPSKK